MSEKIKIFLTYLICILLLPLVLSFGIERLSASGAFPAFSDTQLNLLINIVVYTILPVGMILILHRQMADDVKSCGRLLKWLLPAIILLYGAAILSSALVQLIDGTSTTDNQSMILQMQDANFLLTVWVAVVGGPIAEETVFRYAFLSGWEGAPQVAFLLLSSVLFGLAHMQAGFSLGGLIAYALLGFVFGCLYVKNRNLIFNILAHMGYNGLSLFLLMFLRDYLPNG